MLSDALYSAVDPGRSARSGGTPSKIISWRGPARLVGAQNVQTRSNSCLDQPAMTMLFALGAGRFSRRVLRAGDRAASNALWVIAHIHTLCGPRTRAFAAKRTATGNSRRQVMRMLQRYIAREQYPLIIDALRPTLASGLTWGHHLGRGATAILDCPGAVRSWDTDRRSQLPTAVQNLE